MNSWTRGFVQAALLALAFAVGLLANISSGGRLEAADRNVDAIDRGLALPEVARPQGRGTRPPAPSPRVQPLPPPEDEREEPLVFNGDSGNAGSANGFIAVTGSYGVGTSVLYVLDTVTKQLAVYEARGGSPGSRRVVLVGARRIDLDLELEGYNDDSEFSYRDLERRFERRPGNARGTGKTGEPPTVRETGTETGRK